ADEPRPTWRWRAGDAIVEQTVEMVHGEDTTVVRFRLIDGPAAVDIDLRPLCTSRFYHTLTRRTAQGEPQIQPQPHGLALCWPGNTPSLFLTHNGEFDRYPEWYYDFRLSVESKRGYDDMQDLFNPGVIHGRLRRGDPAGLRVIASTQPRELSDEI